MKTTATPYIVAQDFPNGYRATRYGICWQPFTGSSPIWFTGRSMASAALRPRIKWFKSRQAADKAMPTAIALADKLLSAQY